jgi:hypothetical protein
MATRRTEEEIQSLLEGYRRRTVTRAEYCHQHGIATSTLDCSRRRHDPRPRGFAKVKVVAQGSEPSTAFALVLRNGRRIESTWNFRDIDLTRLIRVAEAE